MEFLLLWPRMPDGKGRCTSWLDGKISDIEGLRWVALGHPRSWNKYTAILSLLCLHSFDFHLVSGCVPRDTMLSIEPVSPRGPR